LFLLAYILMGLNSFAQQDKAKANRALWTNLGLGFTIADSYDNGTVPFHIKGIGTVAAPSATYRWKRYETQLEFRSFNTTLAYPSGTGTNLNLNYGFLYRFHDSQSNRWHQWAGGDLEGFFDIRQIPALQNASSNLSAFSTLGAVWKVEFDFAFNKDKTHNWLTAYGKVGLPIVGVAFRPDFSYVSNGVGMVSSWELLTAEHHIFTKFFPGCNTTLGLSLNLKNGNRIALDYRWDYLTTGKKDIYRYDNAFHSANLTFMFNIFRR